MGSGYWLTELYGEHCPECKERAARYENILNHLLHTLSDLGEGIERHEATPSEEELLKGAWERCDKLREAVRDLCLRNVALRRALRGRR